MKWFIAAVLAAVLAAGLYTAAHAADTCDTLTLAKSEANFDDSSTPYKVTNDQAAVAKALAKVEADYGDKNPELIERVKDADTVIGAFINDTPVLMFYKAACGLGSGNGRVLAFVIHMESPTPAGPSA